MFNPFPHHVIRFIIHFIPSHIEVLWQERCRVSKGLRPAWCESSLPPFVPLSTCVIAPLVQDVLAVIQRNFRSLRGVPANDIVLLAIIPGLEKHGQVEISKEVWPMLRTRVLTVTIALESGAYPIGSWARRCVGRR